MLEPVQGEGGFVAMPADFPGAAARSSASEHGILYVDDEVQAGIGRTGPVWAIEHYGVEPDLIVSGKSLGGGLPLAGVTGRAELMDARAARRARRDLRRQPARRAPRRSRSCARSRATASASAPTSSARGFAHGSSSSRARTAAVGEVRGLGPMLAARARRSRRPSSRRRVTSAARDRGLVLLSCGIYGNVIRILVPLTIDDALLERGLDLLEESLGDARAG